MQKRSRSIHPFVLIFAVVVLAGLAAFLITPGTLQNGVYTPLPRNAVNFNNVFNILRAIPLGLKDTANLVVLILIVGGALGVYQATGAIDGGIGALLARLGGHSRLLLVLILVLFSAMGGFLGWIEVLIPFCPLVVAVVLAMGYDAIVAVGVVILGSMAGFMAGPTNLYTVAVCNGVLQSMGLLPEGGSVFAGLGYRLILWVAVTALCAGYLLLYAGRVRKAPERSLMRGVDVSALRRDAAAPVSFTPRQALALLSILAAMVLTVIGMQRGVGGVKFVIDDVSAVFFASALFSGAVCRLKPGEIADAFLAGARGAVSGAMIVGLARGVYWITNTANINATIIYKTTQLLQGMPPLLAAFGIVVLVSLINGLIPSGSGKGALLSPILFPIVMELGLTPQTAVLAYQFGDGVTNMFWFSYGTLMIFLSYGKVPLQKWWRFYLPLMAAFFVLAFAALGVAVAVGY